VSVHQQLASSGSGRRVAPNAEVVADRAEWSQESLGVISRLEPTHQSLTLACRLM